jgi:tetratricopeptide (TPR) repeat protein
LPAVAGQENILLQDVIPSPAIPPLQALPLDSAVRAKLQEAVKGRHYVEAEQILIDALKQNPKSPQLLSFLGGIYFLYGDYAQSVVAMKKAERLSPLGNGDRFTLAMAYVILNHSDWAQPELERLTQADPRKALYFYWLSRVHYQQKHYAEGVANARKAIQLDPKFTRAHDDLGLCYEALGKYAEAIESYNQALTLNRKARPPSPWPPLDFGALLVKLNRFDDARAYLDEALRYDGRFPQAHYEMGVLLDKQGKQKEAIQELYVAASLNPSYAEPHYALGRIYTQLGDLREAQKEFAQFDKIKQAQQQPGVP